MVLIRGEEHGAEGNKVPTILERFKKRFSGWLLVILGVIAILCLGYSVFQRSDLLTSRTYSIESTSDLAFGVNGQKLIIDNGKCNVLILDSDGNLIHNYEGGDDKAPFYYATHTAQVSNGSIYVADIKYGDCGTLLDWERIIRMDGEKSSVVYECDYTTLPNEERPKQNGRILELQSYNDAIYFLIDTGAQIELKKIDENATVTDICAIPAEGVKTDASYDAETGQIVVFSRNGDVKIYCLADGSSRDVELFDELIPYDVAARNGEVYYTEIQNLTIRHFPIDDPDADEEFTNLEDAIFKIDVSQDAQNLLATNQAGFYQLSIGSDGQCTDNNYIDSASISYFYRAVIAWSTLIVGSFLSLVLIIRLLLFLIPKITGNMTAQFAVIIVMASLAVAFIVSYSLMNNIMDNGISSAATQLDLFSQLMHSKLDVDQVKEIDTQEDFGSESYLALKNELAKPVEESYDNGLFYYYIIYREQDGFFRLVIDYEESQPCMCPGYESEGNEYADVYNTGETVAVSEISAYGAWAYQLSPIIDDDGSIIGILEVGQSLSELEKSQNELKQSLFISVAIGTVVIAMLLIELAFLLGFFQNKNNLQTLDNTDRVPVRTLMFLSYMADSMQDAFIAILCSQLYSGGLPFPNGVAVALPMSMQLLMMALFSLFSGRITEKFGSRRSISIGMAIEMSGFLTCLLIGNYWGILFGKMLIGSGMGIVYVGCNTVAATGGTEEKVASAFASVSAGTLSGLTIGAGLSSILLSMGDWHLIYLAGSAIVGLGLLLALTSGNIMPPKAEEGSAEAGSFKLHNFLFNRHVLGFFLLILLPFMMSLSYREYFFPLFAQENGMDEVRIGQLYLICGVIVLYVGPFLSSMLLKRLGASKSIMIASLAVVADMLIFIVYPSLITVILGVVILSIVISFAYTCQYSYFEQLPESNAYGVGRAMSVYSVFESIGQTVGPISYGALLTLGYQKGIGVFCGAMFALIVIFIFLHLKKSKMSKGET